MPEPTSIRYSQFIQEVSQYRTSDILAGLAAIDPKFNEGRIGEGKDFSITPWGIASIARESILHGSESSEPVDIQEADIRRLHRILDNTYDGPQVNDGMTDSATGILIRLGFEQFQYQESDFEEITRSVALFRDALESMSDSKLTSSLIDSLFGIPLEEAIIAAIVIYCILQVTEGLWADTYLDKPEFQELFELVSKDSVKSLRVHLTADYTVLREHFNQVASRFPVPEHLKRYGYNPLAKYPLVELPDGRIVAPQPRLILWRMSVVSLSYLGSDKIENFMANLGDVIEIYVGQLLQLTDGAQIQGSVPWGSHSSDGESTDWFYILPDCVVLVEVKSARVSVSVRAGSSSIVDDLKVPLDKARKQLKSTHQRLLDGHPNLEFVPMDRPVIGLIVTMGPIRTVNGRELTSQLEPCDFPVLTVSLRELEFATPRASSELGDALKKIAFDPELITWAFSTSLGKFVEYKDNEILDRASSKLPILSWRLEEQ